MTIKLRSHSLLHTLLLAATLPAAACAGDDSGGDDEVGADETETDGGTDEATDDGTSEETTDDGTSEETTDDGTEETTEETGDTGAEAIEIEGTYSDEWGSEHVIDSESWATDGVATFAISAYDNEADWAVAQNGSDNDFNPDLWSRFEWTDDGTSLWYCQVAYDAATEQDALDAEAADPADPANGGCGGFAWTNLTPNAGGLEIAGTYTDEWGSTHEIETETWTTDGSTTFALTAFDNVGQWAVGQNGTDNAFNPDLWSRFEWTDDGTNLWYCQVAFDAATEQDALDAGPADATDPATGGCGGFAWTNLTP